METARRSTAGSTNGRGGRPPVLSVSRLLGIGFALAGLAIAYVILDRGRDGFPPPIDTTEITRNFYEFEPKYRPDECVFRIDYAFDGPRDERPASIISHAFFRYLAEREPSAVFFDYEYSRAPLHAVTIQIADQCDRRFEIADAFIDYLKRQRPGEFELTVDQDLDLPGLDLPKAHRDRLWIDDARE